MRGGVGRPAPSALAAADKASADPWCPPEPPSKATNPDVHVWLAQRIANLEKERETVWQRLMGFVLGKKG